MSLRSLKWLTIILPTIIIAGFEFIRHEFLEGIISTGLGNFLISCITFLIFYFFSTWMFNVIQQMHLRLAEEQSKRQVYEERERIACELHDKIAQILFFLKVMLKQKKVEEANSAVSEIDQHVRESIFNLRSNFKESNNNFSERISNWLNDWSNVSGIQVNVQIKVPEHFFTIKEELELFAVIQEAFINIRKHSKATISSILFVHNRKKEWQLIINDNGIGIKDSAIKHKKYGLSIMKKRIRELKATFSLKTKSNNGTEIIIRGVKQ